jgi:hypothetical protein
MLWYRLLASTKEKERTKKKKAIDTISNLLKLMLRGMLPWLHD